jgi:chloramphenicol 3-O phosphotransferase
LLIGTDTFLPLLGAGWLSNPMEGIHGRHGADGICFERRTDGSVTVTLGPAGHRLLDGFRTSVAALLSDGHDLILDLVLFDGDDKTRWPDALRGAEVVWVGIECALPVLEARERARGDRVPGLARAQAGSVHDGMAYDIVIDSSTTTPDDAAARILGLSNP